jgi:opacity protein-like surface antigen
MHRIAEKLVLGAAILAGVAAAAQVADAKPLKHHPRYTHYVAGPVTYARPPLTVNKRSFLDPGPVVPVGSESAYMVQNTTFATTPDQNYNRSKFGNEALPQPLEVPGRPQPVYQFDNLGYPY